MSYVNIEVSSNIRQVSSNLNRIIRIKGMANNHDHDGF